MQGFQFQMSRLAVVFFFSLVGCTLLFFPSQVQAQNLRALQDKIKALEEKLKGYEDLKKELESLKDMIKGVQKEQETQKTKLAEVEPLKKAVEGLSKVKISGLATGILQGSSGVERSLGGDDTYGVGLIDIILSYAPLDNVLGVLYFEGVGGDGPDSTIPSFAGLNDDAGSTGDNLTVLEAYLKATFFKERLTLTVGKIDLTNYVDTNALANPESGEFHEETAQFLSNAFVNNAVLSSPDNGPGVRGRFDLTPGLFYIEAGVMSQDTDSNDRTTDHLFDDVYGVVEVGYTPNLFGRQGNYRIWGFADGAARESTESGRTRDFTAFGIGASFDQVITDWLGVFFRIGYRDSGNLNYDTQAAWTAGLQISRIIPFRKGDIIGLAYGEIKPTSRAVASVQGEDERLLEAYYRFHLRENYHLSIYLQYLMNRQGDDSAKDILLLGTRFQVDF